MARRKILGLEELRRKLARLPAVAKAMIRTAMEQGATEIVAMMKNLVAVDDGDLRDSIGWTWGKAPKGALTIATVTGTGSASDLLLTIYAGNEKAYYARFVEFGTAAHAAGGKFAGATIPAISPAPFFFVSYRSLKKRTRDRITRATNKAAKQVAAGG